MFNRLNRQVTPGEKQLNNSLSLAALITAILAIPKAFLAPEFVLPQVMIALLISFAACMYSNVLCAFSCSYVLFYVARLAIFFGTELQHFVSLGSNPFENAKKSIGFALLCLDLLWSGLLCYLLLQAYRRFGEYSELGSGPLESVSREDGNQTAGKGYFSGKGTRIGG